MGEPAPSDAGTTAPAQWRPLAFAVLVTVVVLGRSVVFPFLHWDDRAHVHDNPVVAHPLALGLEGLAWGGPPGPDGLGYPLPVTTLSYVLDRQLFGLHPFAFHATNLIVHLISLVLLYLLGLRLGLRSALAGRAALLFGIHPLVVEPVCWVSGRKDLLCTALVLGALVVAARAGVARAPTARRVVGLSLLCVLAVLAKPTAAMGPVLAWLVLRHTWPRWDRWRAGLALAPAAVAVGLLVWVGLHGERAVGAIAQRTNSQAVRDVLGSWTLQLAHVIWPTDLLAGYLRDARDPSRLAMTAAVVASVLVGLFAWRRLAPGSLVRLGLLLAVAAYIPVSGIIAIQRWICDSYMYLPMVGLSLALVAAGSEFWPARLDRVGRVAWPMVIVVLGLLSFMQTRTWVNSSNLWPALVDRYPHRPEPLGLLASAHHWERNDTEAARILVSMSERFPDSDHNLPQRAWAWFYTGQPDRGFALLERGIRAGDRTCATAYWQQWLGSQPPPRDWRALAGRAFRLGLPELRSSALAPEQLRRIANELRRLGEPEAAALAEAEAVLRAARPDGPPTTRRGSW